MALFKFLLITFLISVSLASPIVPGYINPYPYGYGNGGGVGYNHYHYNNVGGVGYNPYGNGGGLIITGVNRPGYHPPPPYHNHIYDEYQDYPVYGGNPLGYQGNHGYGLLEGGAGFGIGFGVRG